MSGKQNWNRASDTSYSISSAAVGSCTDSYEDADDESSSSILIKFRDSLSVLDQQFINHQGARSTMSALTKSWANVAAGVSVSDQEQMENAPKEPVSLKRLPSKQLNNNYVEQKKPRDEGAFLIPVVTFSRGFFLSLSCLHSARSPPRS